MAKGIRKKEGEELSESNIDKVISALGAEKPITKKEACNILNISYNTSRLNKIIETHKEKKAFKAKMRKEMRGKPVDNATASEIISSYLSGESLDSISDFTHRSLSVIKSQLSKYNVPIRNSAVTYFNPIFIEDDNAIAEDYKADDLVYAARYDQPATIIKEKDKGIYHIWLHKSGKFAYQPYYELADLRKIQTQLGIKMKDMTKDEIDHLIYEGLKNQKKQEDKRKR